MNANLVCEGMKQAGGVFCEMPPVQYLPKEKCIVFSFLGKESNLLDPNPVVLRTAQRRSTVNKCC